MEELIIDDKKFVSSKRAAQITGYAKDYIGQLCREGYVEAKRVGRSWYVLEAGIKDHRFGNTPAHSEALPVVTPTFTIERSVDQSSAIETPPINLLRREEKELKLPTIEPVATKQAPQPAPAPSQDFHEAWQTWFETFHGAPGGQDEPIQAQEALGVHAFTPMEQPKAPEAEAQVVPIHYLTPEAGREGMVPLVQPKILEVRMEDAMHHHPAFPMRQKQRSPIVRIVILSLLFSITVISLGITAIGTGYFDSKIASSIRAQELSGITIYNK